MRIICLFVTLFTVRQSSFALKIYKQLFQASTNKSSKKVPLFFYTLYIEGEGSGAAGEGEAIVRVNILDINDNEPVFDNASSEITAAVPTTAEYGHPVTRLQVILLLFLIYRVPFHQQAAPKVTPFFTKFSFYAHPTYF